MSNKPFAVKQIDHVELCVPDQYEAARWYEQVLGLKILKAFEHWAEGGRLMISSDQGSTKLALFKCDPPGSRPLVGHKRIAFLVDAAGFMDFLDHIERVPVYCNDGQQVLRKDVVDHDQSWSIYFCDPYGNRYEVTTYDYEQIRSQLKR